ncbi:MAG TPA: sensor histidine kinase [Candidatus Acidoferrales bacterium]|jgi:signal transduction histidine kinase|nr:sensor histidine kinase [Candidatus Acidoferrales bacterium]
MIRWTLILFLAAWETSLCQPLRAQDTPDYLTIHSATVDGRTVTVNRARNLNLGPFPADTTFYFGSVTNPLLPGLRIRHKLDGYENAWHDGPCEMYFAVRFFNSQGDQIIQNTFTVSGESAGWNGSLATSPLTHRRELVVVPPRASRLLVVISSAGPPAALGVYVVANLTVSKINGNSTPEMLMEFPPNHGLNDATNFNLSDWVRDGNVPSMAKIVTVGQSPSQPALGLLDNDPNSHAEWHNSLPTAPEVTPGDQILVEWNEMYSMGVADLRTAHYQNLPVGNFRLRVADFDIFGKPAGNESMVAVVVSPPFWRQSWFWPACAAAALAVVIGIWRYLVWRRMRGEMLRLKNQQVLEKERLRIAQDIHDDLGARITEISLVSALAKKGSASPESARADFDKISTMSRDLVSALYETVWAVNPENDNLDALGNYLCQMTNHLCKHAQLPCRLEILDLPQNIHVSSQVRHNVAMAVKEATHNVIKHAKATEITLGMALENGELRVCIKDNGVGFDPAKLEDSFGNGLNNMKRRLADIGGSCTIESHPGQGSMVQLCLKV